MPLHPLLHQDMTPISADNIWVLSCQLHAIHFSSASGNCTLNYQRTKLSRAWAKKNPFIDGHSCSEVLEWLDKTEACLSWPAKMTLPKEDKVTSSSKGWRVETEGWSRTEEEFQHLLRKWSLQLLQHVSVTLLYICRLLNSYFLLILDLCSINAHHWVEEVSSRSC